MTINDYMLWNFAPREFVTSTNVYTAIDDAIATASKQLGCDELRPNQKAAMQSVLKD